MHSCRKTDKLVAKRCRNKMSSSRRHFKRLNKKKVKTQAISEVEMNSSKCLTEKDMENASYEDLLEEYKRIQSQLKELELEEQNDIIIISDDEIDDRDVDSKAGITEDQVIKCENIDNNNDDMDISEDDDEELELRRLALESKKSKNNDNCLFADSDKSADDELDENELREQLLKSLFSAKIKNVNALEKVSALETNDSKGDIVSVHTNQTESKSDENCSAKAGETCLSTNLKTKLIINFGDDSSEDEQENQKNKNSNFKANEEKSSSLTTSLDSFLKQARLQTVTASNSKLVIPIRKKSAAVGKLSLTQQMEYKKLKEEIARREKSQVSESVLKLNEDKWQTVNAKLQKKMALVNCLKTRVAVKRSEMRKAQLNVRRIQESFIAATKVMNKTATEFRSVNNSLKAAEKAVLFEENNINNIEKQCVRIGLKLKGNTYKLPTMASLKSMTKDLPLFFNLTKMRSKKEQENAKKHLQILEKLYRQKLQVLKNSALPQTKANPIVNRRTVSTKFRKTNLLKLINNRNSLSQKMEKSNKTLQSLLTSFMSCVHYYPLKSLDCFIELMFTDHNTKCLTSHVFVPSIDSDRVSLDSSVNIDINVSLKSVLHHLHSYRFVDSHNENISSDHWANNVNPFEYICPYDLLGTCNDEKCARQHLNTCLLDSCNKIVDILLYQPKVAGISIAKNKQIDNDLSIQLKQKLLQYAKNIINSNTKMSTEDHCRTIVNVIKTAAQKSQLPAILLTRKMPKRFISNKLEEPLDLNLPLDQLSYRFCIKDKSLILNQAKISQLRLTADPDIYFKNRFYAPEGVPISAELEKTLASDQNNIQLWIKLAYYHITKSNYNDDYIDRALNVLSRALEYNKTDPELYEHYLFIYSNRVTRLGEDSRFNLLNICRKMVQYCSHYRVWKCYLCLSTSFNDKNTVSYDMLTALINNSVISDNFNLRSHQILEVLMYRIQLNLQINNFDLAIEMFSKALNNFPEQITNETSGDSSLKMSFCYVSDKLTVDDRVFAWLCYIHLLIFHSLPTHCFDLFKQGFQEIINKTPFIFDWKNLIKFINVEEIQNCFKIARESCYLKDKDMNDAHLLAIYINLIELNRLYDKQPSNAVFEELINMSHLNSNLYPLIFEYKLKYGSDYEIIFNSLQKCSYNYKIAYYIACHYYEKEDLVNAKNQLLTIVANFYYCEITHLLLRSAFEALIFENDENIDCLQLIEKRKTKESSSVLIWLCYILLLKIEKSCESEIDVAFQSALALCSIDTTTLTELQLLWWNYLAFIASHIVTQKQFLNFFELVRHCCVTISDSTFRMQIVNYFCEVLPNNERLTMNILNALIHFVKLMPECIYMTMKAISFALENSRKETCWSLINFIIFERKIRFLHLDFWKISIALAIEKKDHMSAHKIFQIALSLMPCSTILWQTLKAYETNLNHVEHLKQAKLVCVDQLNISWDNINI